MKKIAELSMQFCTSIADMIEKRDLPIETSLPLASEQNQVEWPGVVFLVLRPTTRFTSRTLAERLIDSLGLPERGSFGHRSSSILPIGLRWETEIDGLVRIAFGSDDSAEELVGKFKLFLDQNY